jgi:hypothetical protein
MREQPRSAHVVVVTDARKPDQFRSIVAIASSPAISAVAVRDLGSDAPHVDVAFPGDPPVDASMRRSVSRAEESAAAMSSVLLPDASLRTRLKAAYAGLLSQASKEAERALSDGQADRPAHRIADPITRFVESQLAKITVVRGSVTFTSRRGSVPVTVSNKTTYPVRVRVSVQSAKLAFPSGRTRVVTIKPPGDTITFVALATSSGTFPLTAAVKGPSGRPKIDQAELTVRSAAANLPAVILTAGGALFLLVVFGRRLGRRRREEREERA